MFIARRVYRRGGVTHVRDGSDGPVAGPRRLLSSAPILRPATIRGRFRQVVVAFLLSILVLITIVVAREVSTFRDASGTAQAVDLTLSAQGLIHELQRERGLTNGFLAGDIGYRRDAVDQRVRVDEALSETVRLLTRTGRAGEAQVATTIERVNGLTELRGSIDAGRTARLMAFSYYTDTIAALAHLDFGLDQESDTTLREQVAALRAIGEAKEATAQERGFLAGVFTANHMRGDDYAKFAEIRATKRAALAQFARSADVTRRGAADRALATDAATQAASFEALALAGAGGRALGVDPRAWWSSMTTLVDDMRAVQMAEGSAIRARAGQLRGTAAAHLMLAIALVGLAVAGQLALAAAGSRAVSRPLADLVREAGELAARRLPQAVAELLAGGERGSPPPSIRLPERAAEETRAVAAALDGVQRVAYELAAEQALLRRNSNESMANLGRRNQNLLRRQMGLISRLEHEANDPSALANLFELDHLATRMRRNAESLLVLVGEESPRLWSTPVTITDVIRASIAEVEEYRRVTLRRIDETYVLGQIAADVAHMIAELVENALAFSPPDADVEIFGRWTSPHYLLVIVDQGLGMSADDLARANARLRGQEDFLVAPTRFLGHYVVGGLAQRLGIDVQLAASPVTGITARLVLPAQILVDGSTQDTALAGTPVTRPIRDRVPELAAVSVVAPPVAPAVVAKAPTVTTTQTTEPATTDRRTEPAVSWFETPLPADSGADTVERTRNGLVKRVRGGHATTVAAPARQPATAVVDRPPDQVRTMLTSLRAGLHRGEGTLTDEVARQEGPSDDR